MLQDKRSFGHSPVIHQFKERASLERLTSVFITDRNTHIKHWKGLYWAETQSSNEKSCIQDHQNSTWAWGNTILPSYGSRVWHLGTMLGDWKGFIHVCSFCSNMSCSTSKSLHTDPPQPQWEFWPLPPALFGTEQWGTSPEQTVQDKHCGEEHQAATPVLGRGLGHPIPGYWLPFPSFAAIVVVWGLLNQFIQQEMSSGTDPLNKSQLQEWLISTLKMPSAKTLEK